MGEGKKKLCRPSAGERKREKREMRCAKQKIKVVLVLVLVLVSGTFCGGALFFCVPNTSERASELSFLRRAVFEKVRFLILLSDRFYNARASPAYCVLVLCSVSSANSNGEGKKGREEREREARLQRNVRIAEVYI